MQEIVKNFTLIHVDAPGQEEGAAVYPAGYEPTGLIDPHSLHHFSENVMKNSCLHQRNLF